MASDPALDQRSFLRIIETGSVTAAAREMRTDVSTMSRRLAAMETRLDVKLVERGARQSKPTAAGLRYYEGLRRLLDESDALEAELRNEAQTPRGLLRLAAPTNIGERHIAGWALDFQRAYPALQTELLLDDRYVDLRNAGIDLAIRIGELADSALTARRLGAMELALVAAPSYLAERGTPATPADLSSHDFVLFSFLAVGDTISLSGPAGRVEQVRMASRFGVNNVGAVKEVVLAGGGVHAGPLWLFRASIDDGRLAHVLPDWRPPLYPVRVLHSYGRRAPAKVTRFIDFLGPKFRQLPGILP